LCLARNASVVGYEDHCDATGEPKALEQSDDFVSRLGVEIPSGLIGKKHCRLFHQGASDGDSLLLAP
jgi:hypothetical protein